MAQDFSSVLAGFCDAAKKTEIKERDYFVPPTGKYHLLMLKKESSTKTNDYGPYVQTDLTFKIMDPGELQDREFVITFLINTMKEGDLSYSGQNFVLLANVLAGEVIADNNLMTADAVVAGSCDKGDVIHARVFTTKKGYGGINALSLETPAAVTS